MTLLREASRVDPTLHFQFFHPENRTIAAAAGWMVPDGIVIQHNREYGPPGWWTRAFALVEKNDPKLSGSERVIREEEEQSHVKASCSRSALSERKMAGKYKNEEEKKGSAAPSVRQLTIALEIVNSCCGVGGCKCEWVSDISRTRRKRRGCCVALNTVFSSSAVCSSGS